MTSRTQHFGFNKVTQGDSLKDDGYKPLGADRDLEDLLLWISLQHHHTGSAGASVQVPDPPTLTLGDTAGSLPADTSIYYKIGYVDDNGLESLPSFEVFVRTPKAVVEPGPPGVTQARTGGTLLPGAYNYVLSAWRYANTLETKATGHAPVQIPGTSLTNSVTLTLPSLPLGAHGFNVYRRKPGGLGYEWIAEINMTVATPPSTFVDTGLVGDSGRNLPNVNKTNSQNNVTITLPGATPTVPAGLTWRIYRSYVSGAYENSLLKWVVEETSESSGVITATFVDLGYNVGAGTPPADVLVINEPDPVQLENAAEVQGVLPPANVVYRHIEEWMFPGTLTTKVGTFPWRCPFDEAVIEVVVAILGKGSSVQATDVIIDVNKADAGTGVFNTIFTNQANRPRITVGHFESTEAIPAITELLKGDRLTVDIDQVGGGATRTDADLLVQVVVWGWDDTAASIVRP